MHARQVLYHPAPPTPPVFVGTREARATLAAHDGMKRRHFVFTVVAAFTTISI